MLVKVLGVYQIGYHNRVTGKRVMEQVVVMQNLFHDRAIGRVLCACLLWEHRDKLHKDRYKRTFGFLITGYEV